MERKDDIKETLSAIQKYVEDSFSPTFFEIVNKKINDNNLSSPFIYNKSFIDRRTFAKFTKRKYSPSKNTIICLCFGLELSLEESLVLLQSVGYTLSLSSKFDLVIRFFLENHIYDINLINYYLELLSLELLGYMKKIKT